MGHLTRVAIFFMTRAQIITDLKGMIGPLGQTTPSTTVTDSILATWVNEAYDYMIDEITKALPEYFTKPSTTNTIADQQEYDLPDDFERIKLVNLAYTSGDWKKAEPLDSIGSIPIHSLDSNQGFDQATPRYYIIGDNIGFIPIPTVSVTNGLKIWYVYTPEELNTDASEPAFPRKYHRILKYGAYANYLDQDDEHVSAERIRNRFERRVEQMVETMVEQQVDEPRSVIVENYTDLYVDQNGVY